MTAASSLALDFALDFARAFDRDRAACGYALESEDWWLSVLPLSDLAHAWDRWSRLLEPKTMPVLVTTRGVLRGGGARV
jgi:hypothetical protein